MCLYPKLIKNRKYIPNKKNKGIIPKMTDERVKYVPIGCGKCMECKKQKSNSWRTRLMEEIRENKEATFVTFTFSKESYTKLYFGTKETDSYEKDNEIATKATRLFLELWRKKTKKSIKHWLITELGQNETEALHIHGIIWSPDTELIKNTWKHGITWCGTWVNEQTINYIVKYVFKTDTKHKEYNPKILCSKGIGNNYTKRTDCKQNQYKGKETNESYRLRNGNKTSLPIYYRNKIYSEEQREILWLNKLDKNERWILGQKIDISDNYDLYNNILKTAQEKNIRLKYGDGTKNWNSEQYERERRRLKQEEKIYKANKVEASESPRRRGSNQKGLD